MAYVAGMMIAIFTIAVAYVAGMMQSAGGAVAYVAGMMIAIFTIAVAYVAGMMQASRRSSQEDEPEPGAEPQVELHRVWRSVGFQTEDLEREPPTAPPLWLLEQAEASAAAQQLARDQQLQPRLAVRQPQVPWKARRFMWIPRSDVVHSQRCRALQSSRATPEERRLCQFCAVIERRGSV